LFNVAIRDGKTERNPVTKVGMLREPSGRVRYLSDPEEKDLMKALTSEAEHQRVTVLLQTGLRKSEFLGLRWKGVDLRVGMITIPRSKNGETRHVPFKEVGGWKTLSMVQRYAHLSAGHRQTAIERLAMRKVETGEERATGTE
jgi:integrase